MDSFNKNMKDKMSGFDSDIPEGMSWDEMGPGILNKMPKKKRRLLPFWLFSIIGLISFSGYYIANQLWNSKNNNSEKILSEITELNQNQSIEENYTLNNTDLNAINTDQKQLDNKSDARVIYLNQPTDLSLGQTSNENLSKNVTIKQTLEGKQFSSDVYSSGTQNSNVIVTNSQNSSLLSNYFATNSSEEIRQTAARVSPKSVDSKPLDHIKLSMFSAIVDEILMANDTLNTVEEETKPTFDKESYIEFGGGYMLWSWGASASNAQDINQFEKTKGSFGLNAIYDFRFHKNFGFRTGLQYYNLTSKLDHSFVTKSIKYDSSQSSQVYNILTNRYSSESPARVLQTETRKVRSYNHFHRIQVPIIGHFYSEREKLSYSIGLGVGAQYLLKLTGKSIENNGSFIDYNKSTNVKSFLGISALMDAHLAYSINRHTDIIFGAQVENSLTNWMKEEGSARNPWIYSSKIGFRRRF